VRASVTVPTGPIAATLDVARGRVYVACSQSDYIAVIRDNATGIAERENSELRSVKTEPTIVRDILCLPFSPFTIHVSLLAPTGRQVLPLHAGANDVSRLAPGIYFVRQVSGTERRASKVALTR
jgi:hypothetical protein